MFALTAIGARIGVNLQNRSIRSEFQHSNPSAERRSRKASKHTDAQKGFILKQGADGKARIGRET